MRKRTVIISILGINLDRSRSDAKRWERWRPSVALCQHDDLLVDRFELLHERKHRPLAEAVSADIRSVSPETRLVHNHIEFRDAWDFQDVYEALHEFALNYPFKPDEEEYLVHMTTGTHVAQICFFLLTEARYIPARLIQTSPPARRGHSPSGTYKIIDLDLSLYDRIASRFKQEWRDSLQHLKSGIETRNAVFNELIERVEKVAIRSKAPVLLTGPTGAGKSQLAKRIYQLKKHKNQIAGAFVEVNCATLRGDAAMSTIFGHVKGSYTGAGKDRPGLLRAADGGLLFLDEIGELGLDEQAMLLRALEERRFLPLGADEEVSSDFQLIAGTNRNLQKDVIEGRFREDLLARLNLWTFELPGLNQRREDIEPNLDYELQRFVQAGGPYAQFSTEAKQQYLSFATSPSASWNANFRDLSGSVTRMATLAPGGRISDDVVKDEIGTLRKRWQSPDTDKPGLIEEVLGAEVAAALDLFDRAQLEVVLKTCRQAKNLSEAGRKLFAQSRQQKKQPNDADRLRKYLAKFELSWADVVAT